MKNSSLPDPLKNLIEGLNRMPGIGPKSAQRIALYILNLPKEEAGELANAIREVKENIHFCSQCFNLTVEDPCAICNNPNRDHSIVCVVSQPKDLMAIERTRGYHGIYHILGGVISPLDGIGPEKLHVKELLSRIQKDHVKEAVFATNPTTEGEATIIYLTKLLKPLGLKLSRLATGLPVGSDMDFADEVTLSKALEGRREI